MSIKQGDYLKRLRIERGLSQESLSEVLGISRQSISKWEQGNSAPDIENIKKLSEYFGVSVDSIINGEPDSFIAASAPEKLATAKEEAPEAEPTKDKKKKKHSWLFPSYPVIMVILYCIIGSLFSPKGWYIGWLVLLTIPLFYTGIIAVEKKKPIIFCYPVLVLIIFLFLGLALHIWHPSWILFLTIPIFYIATAKAGKKQSN